MMEDYLQLLEDLAALHNRALALGVNLEKFTNEASKLIDAALDKNFKEEIAEIKSAFRRPSSGAVN
jgi:hypothetical protein